MRRWLAAQVSMRFLAPIFRYARTRVYMANLHRIGDCLIDVGFYVKARELGWREGERAVIIPAPRTRRPANNCAIGYLSRHARITTSPFLYPFLFRCASSPEIGGTLFGQLPLADGSSLDQYLFAMAVQKHWEDGQRPPLLSLDDDHRKRGWQLLRDAYGITTDEPFVCLHVRERGFLREPPTSGHRHLNADISTYVAAVESLTRRGAWVIRMGDPMMKPLPENERVVDYAHRAEKSDWMDVFLAASCWFWLGTNSGLFMLASSFGVPAALTNVAPATFRPWSYSDIFVPKLYFSHRLGRVLTFRESLAPSLYTSHDIDGQGVTPLDNDAEDIVDLADEMCRRLDGTIEYTDYDQQLQTAFNNLHPSYYPFGVTSRIGYRFLQKHARLLEESEIDS